MRAAFLALLAVSVAAQRATITDTGNVVAVSVVTDADGDPTATRTLSTISVAGADAELTTTTSSRTRTTTTADDTETTTTAADSEEETPGNVGAPPPTDAGPMTATTYWYPRPGGGDPLTGTWSNSWIPPTVATATYAAGTVETAAPTVAAQDQQGASGNAAGRILPAGFFAAAGVAAGALFL